MADPQTSGAGWRLSLVMPAFNEAAVVHQAVAEADEALAKLAVDYEVLVVDDGSSDGTADAVRKAVRGRPRVRLLQHDTNRGYGAALRTGFEAARFDRVAFTDADCQFHLSDLACLLPLTEDHPVAVGYRQQRQDSRWRCFISRSYNALVRLLLGTRVRDIYCALKVFRRDMLARLLPQARGFFVNTEMLARARQYGCRVAEAGVRHRFRANGCSKVSLADVPRVLGSLLPFWWGQVLFPGAGTAPKPEADKPEAPAKAARPAFAGASGLSASGLGADPTWAAVLVVLVAALLFFSCLTCPLQEPQEARYAEIPRQMLAEGRWLVPVLHGQPYLDKPPLLYWLTMLSYLVFGVHDWSARLVSSGAGFLTVLLTFLWGRRAAGTWAGLAGALVLSLSPRFIYLERLLTMDSLLAVWVVAALATGHEAIRGPVPRRGWWLLSALALTRPADQGTGGAGAGAAATPGVPVP